MQYSRAVVFIHGIWGMALKASAKDGINPEAPDGEGGFASRACSAHDLFSLALQTSAVVLLLAALQPHWLRCGDVRPEDVSCEVWRSPHPVQ